MYLLSVNNTDVFYALSKPIDMRPIDGMAPIGQLSISLTNKFLRRSGDKNGLVIRL